MRIKCFILFLLLLPGYVSKGQTTKLSAEHFQKAMTYFSEKKMDLAIKYMHMVIKEDSSWMEPYSFLGKWFFDLHRFSEAAQVFDEANKVCWYCDHQFAKPLARSLIFNGQPERAFAVINANSSLNDTGEWCKMRVQATFVQNAILNQWYVNPLSLSKKVNSPDPELFPFVSADSDALYFTRTVNFMDDKLMLATREDTCDEWKSVEGMGFPLNMLNQESSMVISSDGHYLFFTRCDTRSENGWANGGCDLYMAYRITFDTDWTIPQAFGATINTPYYEGMPSVSPDNRELYFVSDRPGGFGGMDIWITRFENGKWQLPVNAGAAINSAGDETAPYIATDNRTLYFTSNGLPGMGGNDLFMSRKVNDSTWRTAVNMGFPINTATNEMSMCLTPDSKNMYFASDRRGPTGNYDIFVTQLPLALMPEPVCYLDGIVYDSLSRERLNYALIYVMNARTGDTLYQFQSNRGDASFMITLPIGVTYARHTERIGYTTVDDTFRLDSQYLKVPLTKNIVMLPFGYREIKPISDTLIATLHFDPNRTELTDSEKHVIRTAIAPWMDEPGMIYYINAYTDNTGTPMINEELSYKRAALVTKEIVDIGVQEAFTFSKGWGEAKMLVPNDKEENRRINRRVEIIVKRP